MRFSNCHLKIRLEELRFQLSERLWNVLMDYLVPLMISHIDDRILCLLLRWNNAVLLKIDDEDEITRAVGGK